VWPRRVVALDADPGVFQDLAVLRLLGVALQKRTGRRLGYPEDVLGAVFIRNLRVGTLRLLGLKLGVLLLEGVGEPT